MHWGVTIVLLLGAVLGHGYVWITPVNRLHGADLPRTIIDWLTQFCLVSFVILPPCIGWELWRHERFLEQPEDGFAAILRGYTFLCAFVGYGNVLSFFLGGYREDDPRTLLHKQRYLVTPARPFSQDVFIGPFAKLLGKIPGNESLQLAVDTKRLLVPHLPALLEGLRIVHISDLHVTGRLGPEWYRHVADQVNLLRPEVIAITGDLVEREEFRTWLVDSLARLRARFGVYFILGNHDLYVDAQQTIDELVAAGLTYVGAASTEAVWNQTAVMLVGNELPWNPRPPVLRRPGTANPFRVFLLHCPDQFDWATAHDCDLALAGHTHGGQIRLPLLGVIASPSIHGTRFACGTFLQRTTVMHVSRGIAGETPFRWNCPPEIAVLELTREPE